MLTRIELKNFMSHRHTVIEPAAGLTVLVGPNNCGKSALVAALQILCSNEAAKYVMRHGERECSVEVETSEGHVVRWTRKASPSYQINGQTFDRLGIGGRPDELHRALRLPKVDGGDGAAFDIHFGCQKSPIFLLDEPASVAAKFFASSSDAIRLVEMQRRHREKYQEKQKEKSRLEAESKQLNAELDALQPAAEIDHRLRAAEELHQELTLLAVAIGHLETESSRIEGQSTVVAYHQAQADVMGNLAAPPSLNPVEPLGMLLDSLGQIRRDEAVAVARAGVLQELTAPPEHSDTPALEGLVAEIAKLETFVRQAEATKTALQMLEPAPLLQSTGELESLRNRLRDTAASADVAEQRWHALKPLAVPPEQAETKSLELHLAKQIGLEADAQREAMLLDCLNRLSAPSQPAPTDPLEKLRAELRSKMEQALELEQSASEIERQRADVAGQVRDLAQASSCPTCGAPLDPERLLALAASGGVHRHA